MESDYRPGDPTSRERPDPAGARLATGIELLDRKLHGGLPVGSLTALEAPPASQSELLLYQLSSVRPTLYVTTARAAADVRRVLDRLDEGTDDVVVVDVDQADPTGHVLDLVEAVPSPGAVVIDVVDRFESLPEAEYWTFVNELRERLRLAGATGFLHCLDGDRTPPQRDTTEYLADVVFRMTSERRGESLENTLTVPKYRGGAAVEDVIKLSLTTGVDVDVSRNIV